MRFTRVAANQLKKSKWREATIRDNYKKDTFVAHVSETHSGTVGWEPSALPIRPIRTPHLNGVNGRHTPQLVRDENKFYKPESRLVFRLSPHGDESGPLRRYIDSALGQFAEENKCTVIYIRPEPNHGPQVSAEWLNGDIDVVSLVNFPDDIIKEQIELLSMQTGRADMEHVPKNSSTQKPSIQGFNFPFLKGQNITELPSLNLTDAWTDDKVSDKYYRDDEKWKLLQKPIVDGLDRKQAPRGPYATSKETPDNMFKY